MVLVVRIGSKKKEFIIQESESPEEAAERIGAQLRGVLTEVIGKIQDEHGQLLSMGGKCSSGTNDG